MKNLRFTSLKNFYFKFENFILKAHTVLKLMVYQLQINSIALLVHDGCKMT